MQSLEYDACPVAVAREIDDSIAFRSGGFLQNGRYSGSRKLTLSKWVIVLATVCACAIGTSLLVKFRPMRPSLRSPPPPPPDLVQEPPIQHPDSTNLDLPDGGLPPPPPHDAEGDPSNQQLDQPPSPPHDEEGDPSNQQLDQPPPPGDPPPLPGPDVPLAESEPDDAPPPPGPDIPPPLPDNGPDTTENPQQYVLPDGTTEHHHHHGENHMDNPDNQHHHHDGSNQNEGHPPPIVHPETPLPQHGGDDTFILQPPDRPLPVDEDGTFTVVHPAHNDINHIPGGSGGHGHPHVDGPTSVTQIHPDERDRRDERPPRDEPHPHDDRVPPEEVFGTYSGPPKRDPPKEEPQTPPDQQTEEDGGD